MGSEMCIRDRYITANGPAAAIDFSLKLTERLAGLEHCQEVAKILFAEE